MTEQKEFTRYEVARILGARALQIAMDAPLLLKISAEDLDEARYDALKIAKKEFESGVLPISVKRPLPRKNDDRLESVREEKVEDEKIIEKEKEIEEEISEKADEMGFGSEDDRDAGELEDSGSEDDS